MLSMLLWTTYQLMRVKAQNRIGAEKGKHTSDRRILFPGLSQAAVRYETENDQLIRAKAQEYRQHPHLRYGMKAD